MTALLDVHALLWFEGNDPKLSTAASAFMRSPQNVLLFSSASLWEMAIKVSIGKLTLAPDFETFMNKAIALTRLQPLPIILAHGVALATLPVHHRDPFDRMLIAQAIVEKIPIVSADIAFDAYPVTRIW